MYLEFFLKNIISLLIGCSLLSAKLTFMISCFEVPAVFITSSVFSHVEGTYKTGHCTHTNKYVRGDGHSCISYIVPFNISLAYKF